MSAIRISPAAASQASLFPDAPSDIAPSMPAGFRYKAELISAEEEACIVAEIEKLQLAPYEFRGFFANRKVLAFGYRYSYRTRKMEKAADIPPFLLNLRAKVAAFAGKTPEQFKHVLVTEYVPGTAIGWHRDRLQYGEIVGVSLLSPAHFRVRQRQDKRWARTSCVIAPRSAYIMADDVRMNWEHSIPELAALRYSLTFRTFSENFKLPD